MAGAKMPSYDLREIDDSSNYAVGRQQEMANLFGDVRDMGSIRLWWDSKVPENDKWFFNCVSFKSSDRDKVMKEIAKHRDFYAEMKDVMSHVRNGDEEAEELVEDLYAKLLEMQKESESKIGSTDSKTLHRMHKDFVEKHQQLENKIKRVEVVALRQQLRRAKSDWREAVNEINEVKKEMQKSRAENEDLVDRFEKLMSVNETLIIQQQELRQENNLIRNLLEELIKRGPDGGSGSQS